MEPSVHVKTLCLAVLSMGDASGYEIKKLLEGPFRHIHEASFGAIYPALARLQEENFVTYEERSQEKRPDKKVYALTQGGRFELIQELTIVPGPDRIRSDFLVQMLYAHLLPPSHIAQVIEQRLDIHTVLLSQLESHDGRTAPAGEESSSEFVRGYGIAVLKAARDYIADNRHLVEGAALAEGDIITETEYEELPTGVAAT
jgi:PadR family transcriptional regulator AphA